MRFSEDTPAEQARARTEVAAWREQDPGGTAEEMVAALLPGFHKDYGPFLRSVLFRMDDERRPRDAGTTATGMEAGSR
ncbi:MAG: hypothetical protein ACRDPY_34575 [Streptosporangiaceae bacterium]